MAVIAIALEYLICLAFVSYSFKAIRTYNLNGKMYM